MGADGGSIVGRSELAKTKKRTVVAHDTKLAAKDKVNSCAISHQPLQAPVVVCEMGWLYNKESVLEYLLSKKSFPIFSHLQSLKDVKPVNINWNATAGSPNAPSSTMVSNDSAELMDALYSCPLTGVPSNGVNRFVACQPCGCVISERAWKSVAGKEQTACIVCNKTLATDAPSSESSHPSASSIPSSSSTAAASSAAVSPSPFHHPSFLTLFPTNEEELYLREQQRLKEEVKAKAKAAKKAAKAEFAKSNSASTAPSTASAPDATDAAANSGKRKAQDQAVEAATTTSATTSSSSSSAAPSSVHVSKKHIIEKSAGSSSIGNSAADHVRAITAAAAASIAEKAKDSNIYASMFLSEQSKKEKFDQFSGKLASSMPRL